jgi:predicted nuclease of predicted toxin-antitoxin system
MRFLIDTNLPKALARWLAAKGHECEHVLALGLAQAKDGDLWKHAASTGASIIGKDQDFADLARASRQESCVVWLRTGNGTTPDLLAFIEPLWPQIETRLMAGERLIEIR